MLLMFFICFPKFPLVRVPVIAIVFLVDGKTEHHAEGNECGCQVIEIDLVDGFHVEFPSGHRAACLHY